MDSALLPAAIPEREQRLTARPSFAPQRLDRIDLLRAIAMVWMTVYHFCFDLNHQGLISENFYRDPFWTWQRTVILSLFLFTAGLSQAVALGSGGITGRRARSARAP